MSVFSTSAGLWAVLTLGYGARGDAEGIKEDTAILANQSLLLVLVLTHHFTQEKGLRNPYRKALSTFANSQGKSRHILMMFLLVVL